MSNLPSEMVEAADPLHPILGFASAGAGNRTGRRIYRHDGVVPSARERNRRQEKRARDVSLDDSPPKDELMRYIEAGRCWWCNDGRIFRSLSGHWRKAHGIDAQWVRDYLGLSKKVSFIGPDLRERFAERGRERYDPDKLSGAKGTQKTATTCFRESQRRKSLAQAQSDGYQDLMRERSARAHRVLLEKAIEKRKTVYPCVICGRPVEWKMGKNRPKTCSLECDRERRARASKKFSAEHRPPRVKKCAVCGRDYTSHHRKTCSPECTHILRSQEAKTNIWKLNLATEARLEKLRNRPRPVCAEEGCGRPAICKGLCSMHYQRRRAALAKAGVTP